MVKAITPANFHGEIGWGAKAGGEAW